ncbi:MAG TPA: hypothetical protein VFC70_05130 [Oscillospiraceae bacterium]|nr:hypothetical protein [Oscillospiraceae bacterium]
MSNYGKYNKYLIAVIMVVSLCANLFFISRLWTLKQKVASTNISTSAKFESAIRDTMYLIKELDDTETEETINNLQSSVKQLVLIFNSWIDLNQSNEKSDESLEKGLGALETLRNTIVYHLGNQYSNNGGQLTYHDMVFLDRVYDKLDRLLVTYGNIEKHTDKIKNANDKGSGGLCQWAASMDEISKLYRHSRIPNEHPEYIGSGTVLAKIDEIFPMFRDFQDPGKIEKIEETVQIREGVHYYEISYYHGGELSYLVWMDAIDGSLRLFEDYTGNYNNKTVDGDGALGIAKDFMNRLEPCNEVVSSMSIIKDENSKNTIYAFQFIPVSEGTTIISDCIDINVSSKGGNIIKYSSSFSNTQVPNTEPVVTLEGIQEKYEEEFVDMEYDGLSVVRSFYTYYRPVVAYNYKSTEKKNTTKLYFDVITGNQVYESYSVYEPISYIKTENCH